ncbi:CD48 antigen-like [Hoplias malabaricus]|uniref:CD48 antigen-like n=1 Tax=Hoplias malabaricus TaxID=27720 RepID=UPI003462DBFA
MGYNNGVHVLYSGAMLLVLRYGVCVLSEENTVIENRDVGSSLTLPLGYPKESVTFGTWKFIDVNFATYTNEKVTIYKQLHFNGRLKVGSDNLSVEVTNLQLQDSGLYYISALKPKEQLPTKIISLTVHAVLTVQIESNQTWTESKNMCKIDLRCRAGEDQSVSYTWSGFKTQTGPELSFTLSEEQGEVTLSCTAATSNRTDSNTTRVKCTPTRRPTDTKNDSIFMGYLWIAAGGGAAAVLLIAIILVSCWWRSHKGKSISESGSTVYADVNPDYSIKNDKRPDSINVASIYETVDELRTTSDKPQTLYDKVSFAPRLPPGHSSSSSSSPYQMVL